MTAEVALVRASLRTPRAAAIAGIAFALIMGTALALIRVSIPADPRDAATWLDDSARRNAVRLALNLVPFAGLAFLWFMGAVRDRIGAAEDRFFATVFLGTGLLFVAMLFVAAGVAGGLLEAEAGFTEGITPETWRLGRHTSYQVLTVYSMRMAGAFTIVTTTIGRKLRILPPWLTVAGMVSGIALLLTVQSFAWAQLLFPLWVLVLSVYLLVRWHDDAGRDPVV